MEAGFLYDSTILETPEGESVSQGMAARLWPYTLQDGVAQDCKRCCKGWERAALCVQAPAYGASSEHAPRCSCWKPVPICLPLADNVAHPVQLVTLPNL